MGVREVMAEYDKAIDELADDAEGYHDAVSAMHRDVQLEGQGLSPQQVSRIAQADSRQADAEEGLDGLDDDDDEEYSLSDLDDLDAEEDRPRRHRRRRRTHVVLTIVVPPSERGFHLEALCSRGNVVAHRPVAPSGRPRKVKIKVPVGRATIRLMKPVHSRKIAATKPGVIDMRRRRGRRQ